MTYEAPGVHRRSDAERRDQALAWARSDRSFFAAGACHVLAFEFLRRPAARGFIAVGLQRAGATYFDHVYASDGRVAFDYCGWTLERELITETVRFESLVTPGVELRRVELTGDLDELCTGFRHRPPASFIEDPRPRANRFLDELLNPSTETASST